MKVRLAQKYGFCFGVKRAIAIAENNAHATTFGPLIHNSREIERLQRDFDVSLSESLEQAQSSNKVIVRTHGITKEDLQTLKTRGIKIIDATCPFVTKPQNIVEQMSKEGYQIIIFGDSNHPEVKGVASYGENVVIVGNVSEAMDYKFKKKVAVVSQTTKQPEQFGKLVGLLASKVNELRVFNTICNATFENQRAVFELSKEVDIMIIVGGKNSSNTKQLLKIAQDHCVDSYLVEDQDELEEQWFMGKTICGLAAGASTPDWIIQSVHKRIEQI
ncbi:4-hydroxy-3-methylbut-2-enyl diphosphate reductase [Helicobacter marmotae]|uniref:4-hydroxy-3-methylbut-2-enyl diphosphate reductase n=1 Tax=Helicobacter marmotae TaxID=152490 RepID=A0A3D8I7I6_9HELI|nr:4-hydroxy-3-methylbut-2-enyl diphosphate reductase [Helicobacter marmotae]RDU60704.1 4-hydroxy-3-methylbut-2-enyl diphosphate reductase [Helicobacter marmotae]